MIEREYNGIKWLEYELLADFKRIDHRVFLRHGGNSQGQFQSLNFNTSNGDNPLHVKENHEIVRNLLGQEKLVTSVQKHGAEVVAVTNDNKHSPFAGDGLTTKEANLPLLIKHADCQAACFYDPINHALSLVHCGWRGNVQNIYAKTVQAMQNVYGSKPADLLVCISPSLGPERSEFINYKTELPESFWQFQYKPFYFDLWALSEWQLISAGILPHHIQIARISTWSNPDDYFSYRRSHIIGNNGTTAMLKPV